MVRFQWHAEDGSVGQVLPGNFVQDATSAVYHATAEIRVPGQRATVEANFALPRAFLKETKSIGIVLSLGERSLQWNVKFLIELGTALAKQGYVVMRFLVKFDEQRKQTEIEKTIGACIASPYARYVKRWVLIGVGQSSHISCYISQFFGEMLMAMVFVASPFTMEISSEATLKPLEMTEDMALLFLHPSVNDQCSASDVLRRLGRQSVKGIKYMNIPDVDQNFRSSRGKNAAHLVSAFVVSAVLEFLNLLDQDRLEDCMIPSLEQMMDNSNTSQDVLDQDQMENGHSS